MISMTLSNLRKSTNFFEIDEVAKIINGRKNEEIGYFVPKAFKYEFEKFMFEVEKKKKRKLLQRVATASRKNPIEEGAVADGIG